MFNFIKKENEKARITEEYIGNIEKKLDIKFPTVLREYYLQHNGAEIEECSFEMYDIEFSVLSICDFYGTMTVEKIIENDLRNDDIPNECYPIAEDDINRYYWNTADDKIYYYEKDEEEPTVICESIEAFFEILNKCCKENSIKIKGKLENMPNPYLKLVNIAQVKDNADIDTERILRYNGKFVKVCIWIALILLLICLLGMKFIDVSFLLFIPVPVLFLPVFVIIDIINRIITKKALCKYDISEIKKELQAVSAIKLKGIETYLTKNYIISNSKFLKITKYDEITWIYLAQPIGTVAQQGTVAVAYQFGGTPLIAHLNTGKKERIAFIRNNEHLNFVLGQVFKKNSNALIGYSVENREKYKNRKI